MSPRSALFLLGLGVALGLSWLWPRIQQPPTTHAIARELLATGRPDDALILFDEPVWRGIAEYRAGRYARAVGAFFPPESVLALYNIGTSHAQLESWNGAIAAYEKVLRLDPDHADARHNLELVLLAAEVDADEAMTPSPNSPMHPGEGAQQQQVGDELLSVARRAQKGLLLQQVRGDARLYGHPQRLPLDALAKRRDLVGEGG